MKFRPKFALRTLFVLLTAIGVVCAYHANWIRQRHEFLAMNKARQAEHDANVARWLHERQLGRLASQD
jgi:hypothetical protein